VQAWLSGQIETRAILRAPQPKRPCRGRRQRKQSVLERWLKWIGCARRVGRCVIVVLVLVVRVEEAFGVEEVEGVRRARGMRRGCGCGEGIGGVAKGTFLGTFSGTFLGSSSEQCCCASMQGLQGRTGLRLFREHLRFASAHAVHRRYRLLTISAGATAVAGLSLTGAFVPGLPSSVIRVLV